MDKVIIFSSYYKLAEVNGKLINLNNLSVLKDNNFTGFDEASQTFRPIQTYTDADLILINDEVNQYEFNPFIEGCDRVSCIVLKHRKPTFSDFEEYKMCYLGMHEQDGKFYPEVLQILADGQPQKRERLLSKVFHLDPVLANKILFFQAVLNESFPAALVAKLEAYKPAIETFTPFLKSDLLSPDYIAAFEQLYSSIMLDQK
jgi:hypothetical protein